MKLLHALNESGQGSGKRPSIVSAGFTIVELMIAMLIFSVIMIVVTYGVIHFSTSYYKGLNSSTTQNVARNIIDSISQGIQFADTDPVYGTLNGATGTNPPGYICAGNQEFAYSKGNELPSSPSGSFALLQYSNAGPCINNPDTTKGTELLQPNMRLTDITITHGANPTIWTISVKVAYGDNDLLCDTSIASPTTAGSCARGAPAYTTGTAIYGNTIACKSTAGSQFCATSSLSTTVQRRVE